MYQFSSISDNLGGISAFYHTFNDNVFCVVIETNDYDIRAYNQKLGLHELFANVFYLIKADTKIENIPSEFANKLDLVLRESNKNAKEGASVQANFTGVALTKDRVYICTAGFCRVHLVQKQRLIKVTRDHNFVSDLFNETDIKSDLDFEKNPAAFFVPTRTLGIESPENKYPESVSWEVEEEYTILICTSRYHKFQDPSKYIKSFILSNLKDIAKNELIDEGFLALIEKSEIG